MISRRRVAEKLVRATGLPALATRLGGRDRAAIALYHDPRPEVLDAHLGYLGRRFTFTTLHVLAEALAKRDWSLVPERALVVTIDDGYRRNRELLPVFRRHGVRPTLYVCTSIVGTHRRFWFDEVEGARRFKEMPNVERLKHLREEYGFEPTHEYPQRERQVLSDAEIEEMSEWVDFEPHTRFHPILPRCDDDEAREEIVGSRRELERKLGRPCTHFAYPNGDCGDREVEILAGAGFLSGRTTRVGWVGPDTDPYRLPIRPTTDDASVDMLAIQISGLHMSLRAWLRGLRP